MDEFELKLDELMNASGGIARAEVREYMKKMAAERGLLKPNGNVDDGPFLRSLTKEERATLKKMFDEIEDKQE